MELIADNEVPGALPRLDGRSGLGLELVQVMDELAYGVVVATGQARVLHANQSARHELARRRALAVEQGVLRPTTAEGARLLQEGLAKAMQGKRSLVTLGAVPGPALSMVLVPLQAESRPKETTVGLLFARAAVCDPLMLCFFARSHHLTPAEEQVLGVLCQGYSAPEAALQLKVAVSTVRSHVRSLCAKTRSSGVRELVNRLAVLPPVAPALWHEPMH